MTTLFCGDCGGPRRSEAQRFCSQCGHPFDDAHDAAGPMPTGPMPTGPMPTGPMPTGPVPAGPVAWEGTQIPTSPPTWAGGHPTPDYALPAPVPPSVPPTTDARGSRAGRVIGIGALVLALGGAGLVAWQVFGPQEGADSPEAAAETFMSAVADQDGIALLSVVNPGEVAGLDDVYETARKRLDDEGLIEGGELSGAVDVSFDNLEFDVDELGDGVARVTLTEGTMTATYDPSELPDRLDFVTEDFPDKESEEIDLARVLDELDDYETCDYIDDGSDDYDCTTEDSGIEIGMTTVEIDGRWYVSLLGTAADLLYQDAAEYDDVRRPDYDATTEAVDPIVGEDPEEVVDNLVEAINDQDVSALLDQMPADLAVGLRPYARTIDQEIAQAGISGNVSKDDLDYDTDDLDGDLLKVTITNAEFSGDTSADDVSASGTLALDGTCVDVSGESYDAYYGDSDSGYANWCVPSQVLDDSGIDDPFLIMRKVDGGYQLDPVATVTTYASMIVENVPGSLIDEAIEAIDTGDESFFDCYLENYC